MSFFFTNRKSRRNAVSACAVAPFKLLTEAAAVSATSYRTSNILGLGLMVPHSGSQNYRFELDLTATPSISTLAPCEKNRLSDWIGNVERSGKIGHRLVVMR